ncbi:inactive peptidyl-prolyl cis-trans isomerase FKBP6 isoform X2 [Thrips palmi]|nr:inactive peptidyl-prolyl cis-trans isomerase FKBP6 isoform X2 [Thrips palmi]
MRDGGVTFSVKDQLDVGGRLDYETPEDVFDPDSLIGSANFNTLDAEDHSGMPFEAIKEKMEDVTPTGSVKKRVLRQGIGEKLPKDCLVTIHYDAYLEFNEVPYDSSTLRGKAWEFVLGNSGVLIGLDLAVATMREKEKAEFILHPSVAFGKMGCPPRIPQDAELFFVIEVIRFKIGSEAALARATELTWDTVKPAFIALNKEGISLYNECRYKESKMKLEKAKRQLEQCHLKNEAEEEEQKHYLFKVCLNLALALNKMKGSASFAPSAIMNCKQANEYKPGNAKVHLQWGIALITLGELERARDHLAIAKRKLPGDQAVSEAWEKLERKKKHEREEETLFWKRAVNPTEKPDEKQEDALSGEAAEIFKQLKEFSSNPSESSLTLPSGVTSKEREEIEMLAEKLKLNMQFRDKSILITKS